jgi:hypothetical protein
VRARRSAQSKGPRLVPPTKRSRDLPEPVLMQHARCWNCGYNLFGSCALHRCPECGAEEPWASRRKPFQRKNRWTRGNSWREPSRLIFALLCCCMVVMVLSLLLSLVLSLVS